MEFYIVLSATTACVAGLAVLLYLRSGSLSFPLGVLFIYFWSMHGGWSIVADGLGADTPKPHHYLYRKLFPVELNAVYQETLLYYALFVIIIELTALAGLAEVRPRQDPPRPALWISHVSLLVMSVLAAAKAVTAKNPLRFIILKSSYAFPRFSSVR